MNCYPFLRRYFYSVVTPPIRFILYRKEFGTGAKVDGKKYQTISRRQRISGGEWTKPKDKPSYECRSGDYTLNSLRVYCVGNDSYFIRVAEFKHAWYSLYFPTYEHIYGTYDDLDRCMKTPSKYSNAITFVKQYIIEQGRAQGLEIDFECIFIQHSSAYAELLKHSPKSRIDINDGNFGFSPNGILKVFDMQ